MIGIKFAGDAVRAGLHFPTSAGFASVVCMSPSPDSIQQTVLQSRFRAGRLFWIRTVVHAVRRAGVMPAPAGSRIRKALAFHAGGAMRAPSLPAGGETVREARFGQPSDRL